MSLSKDELALLDDISDDWYRLWEVDWYFNGAHPDWPFEKRRDFVSDLVSQGMIEIFFGPFGSDKEAIKCDQAQAVINDATSWVSPSQFGEPCYQASTSPAGVKSIRIAAGI